MSALPIIRATELVEYAMADKATTRVFVLSNSTLAEAFVPFLTLAVDQQWAQASAPESGLKPTVVRVTQENLDEMINKARVSRSRGEGFYFVMDRNLWSAMIDSPRGRAITMGEPLYIA